MKIITVFEHQTLKLGQEYCGQVFNEKKLKALQNFHGDKGLPYYSLINNGVKFNEHVGVIQVGNAIIEILPKADKTMENDVSAWRNILIDMLFSVGVFDKYAPSVSSLKLKPNSILDLYFELFIKEVEYLIHSGLVKKYRKVEGNVTSLKGSLKFDKHIMQNLVHQERFYVNYSNYDVHHLLHIILYKTLNLLKSINTNSDLQSRIGALLLNFPEMPDIKINSYVFDKIVFNRKTMHYQRSIEIAKLLLLQYHPDVTQGDNNILALMFDMNKLWEKFVYVSLRKHKPKDYSIIAQSHKDFWISASGSRVKIIPDIVIKKGDECCYVIDTKWKNLNGYNPSTNDLRQMYVYHDYFNALKTALVYPGNTTITRSGRYFDPQQNLSTKECNIVSINVEKNIKEWQKNIASQFNDWLNP